MILFFGDILRSGRGIFDEFLCSVLCLEFEGGGGLNVFEVV